MAIGTYLADGSVAHPGTWPGAVRAAARFDYPRARHTDHAARERRIVTRTPARSRRTPEPGGEKTTRHRGGAEGGGLLVVGIGASAGGLDAFKRFFTSLPPDTGMAFVLVQHLSPDHKSMLADLLGKATAMRVTEAADGAEVTANCVFVIPPDATMTIAGGRLKVARPAPPRERRRPIDTFLQSLAEDQGENAVCIILSGTGSDGTLGVAAIKEHGGLTLAQAEHDSQALPGMPQSAAASGQVDDVLAVEAMPAKLVAYQRHLLAVAGNKDGDGTRMDAASHMSTILAALRARSGHDFSEYKEKTLVRRLQRRMQLLQIDSPAACIQRFREQPEELDRLFRELLIGVTQFFRDPGAFEALSATVLQELVTGRGAHQTVRVWVPGCATGQEAFSIAILLREAMQAGQAKPKVQIFGTDIDERAIAVARLGRYRRPVAGLSAARAERWFSEEGDDLCVVPEVREMCVFSTHSIIKDPPFSKLDLVACRNLLIYLDPALQDRAMRSFHYALKPGGRLFLGSSESVTRSSELFGPLDKKHRIFERRDTAAAALPDLGSRGGAPAMPPLPDARPTGPGDRIDRGARRVMEKYTPPHVVIDRQHQIIRFSGGSMGRYLEPAAGAPSFALFDILRRPLRLPVRNALQQVRASKAPVRQDNVQLRIDGRPQLVTLIAEPIGGSDDDSGYVVLVFQDGGCGAAADETAGPGEPSSDTLRTLNQELLTSRTQLRLAIDELEIANEEMKSSNEEYQSVNEELQSSNEELETAKEEMQSVNEELQTINTEMVNKNEQLTRLNSDIRNLLESTEIATLFLDDHLRIKNFTRGVTDIFSVRDADIGRPITDITSLISHADLQRDVKAVLRNLAMMERRVTLADKRMSFEMRIRPYRTIDNFIDGVVCTFVDVTAREAGDLAMRRNERQFHALADAIPQLAWIADARGGIFWVNQRWFDYTNTTQAEVKGRGWQSLVQPADADRVVAHFKTCIETGEVWEDTFQLRGADGRYRWFLSRARPIRDDGGTIMRWFGTNTDIEEQRRSGELRELLLRELDHRVKNLFAVVGGIVTLSARSAATPKDLVKTIQGRLGALASAHVLIRTGRPGSIGERNLTVDAVIRAILAPHADVAAPNGDVRVAIEGPEVAIGGEPVTSLALVLHELATNASKYGALSTPGGQVRVCWEVRNGRLELQWQERGGPLIDGPPEREGFGSVLARRSVTGQLNGELAFDWDRRGLTVHLSVATERLMP
jgi:two-component system CheB/CheR fusion protein